MTIKIKIHDYPKRRLNARKTLDNNILIFDHDLIDIVINLSKNLVSAYPKYNIEQEVYLTQNDLFEFLFHKGLIDKSSIKSGNVYRSIEAKYFSSDEYNPIQLIVYCLSEWLEKEKRFRQIEQSYEEGWEDLLTNPEEEDSTELGEVPQSPKKGVIDPQAQKRLQYTGIFI